ncbi:MAG: type II toxin-antitoxin system RelE/ParE family toxin [Oscillospiraceae bacterium]|nr:type II toxin-antitoxin system RelE/ParE family toxin [Oscillospiraceae bacterium]
MTIVYSKDTAKALSRMDAPTKQRIKQGIQNIPGGDIKPLKGTKGTNRLRIGDWRILFSYMKEDEVFIRNIGSRGDVYKGG